MGAYTNKIRDSTVKTILDLKSDTFPGAQIYIYVNIQLLDPLPEKKTANTPDPNKERGTVVDKNNDSKKGDVIDIKENMFKI